jgi:dTDP-4-amino-4,6-dideoxygalactose transaminase
MTSRKNDVTATYAGGTAAYSGPAITFNRASICGRELEYIADAAQRKHLSGNGHYTRKCDDWLESTLGIKKAFLTHSGTAALEMAALLADIQPGDEVIMPSFTFVTTASSFVLRGGVPVFVDIRSDNLQLDERLVAQAVTDKTKAIVPVHYAGVCSNMEVLGEIAEARKLFLIEDAAHALMSKQNGKYAGSFGHMAALSFHETKNVVAGEGGALLINEQSLIDRAHMVWEKGTDRRQFTLGAVDKYTWRVLGSSFPPNELTAAFLFAQLECARQLTEKRVAIWTRYQDAFRELEKRGLVRLPMDSADAPHNGHMYFLILNSNEERSDFIKFLADRKISAVFHYIPLHSSPAGMQYGRADQALVNTDLVSSRLVRLPLWPDLDDAAIDHIVASVIEFFE